MPERPLPTTVRRITPSLGVVTPVGRAVVVLAVAGFVGASRTGFEELRIIAVLCVLLLVTAAPFVFLPTSVRATLELRPTHTVLGETGTGVVRVTNLGRLPILAPQVVVPVAGRPQRAWFPVLHQGRAEERVVEVRGRYRGVLPVGPASAVRTDPLGLLRRETGWTPVAELYVRPRMVDVDALAPGFVPDLEGVPRDALSMSDLAFHALREYVRGDDLRHVHWRSSARTGELHVRQYHDTRRSHAAVLVDTAAASYADPDELELVLSIVASLGVRLARGEHELTFVCGTEQIRSGSIGDILDACCRAALGGPALLEAAATTAALGGTESQLLLATGSRVAARQFEAVRALFPADLEFVGFRADLGAPSASVTVGRPRIATVPRLDDLPLVLAQLAEQGTGPVAVSG